MHEMRIILYLIKTLLLHVRCYVGTEGEDCREETHKEQLRQRLYSLSAQAVAEAEPLSQERKVRNAFPTQNKSHGPLLRPGST